MPLFFRRGQKRRAALLALTAALGMAGLWPASAGVIWTTLPSVPQPELGRADAASAEAPCPTSQSGSCVYVLGGEDAFGGLTNDVSVYDPAANAWTAAAPMPTARKRFGAASAPCPAAAPGGGGGTCVYAFGGETATSSGTSVLEVYRPASNTWLTAASMPTGRSDFGAAAAPCPGGSGTCVYAVAGFDQGDVFDTTEVYNPATNGWTTITATLPTGREALASAAAPCPLGQSGTCVYAVGGFDLVNVLDDVLSYNPVTNTWTPVQPMESPRFFNGAATAPCPAGQVGSCVYVVGRPFGETELERTESYNPVTNAWSTLPSTPVDRSAIATAAAVCPTGQVGRCVYAAGGRRTGGAVSNVFESLNPGVGSGTPAATADLEATLTADRAAVRINKKVTYTFTVKNLGPDSVDATASLALPSRQGFVSVTGASCQTPKPNVSGVVQCHLPDLDPGATTVITVVAKGKQLGPATTQASVSPVAPAGDPNSANNTAAVSVPVTLAG